MLLVENGMALTIRPNDRRVTQTENRSRPSNRSTDWKVSSVGTPNFLAAPTNALIFSMQAKLEIGFWIFFTVPGSIPFASLY